MVPAELNFVLEKQVTAAMTYRYILKCSGTSDSALHILYDLTLVQFVTMTHSYVYGTFVSGIRHGGCGEK